MQATTPSQNTAGSVYILARFFFDAKTTHNGVLASCSAIFDVTTARYQQKNYVVELVLFCVCGREVGAITDFMGGTLAPLGPFCAITWALVVQLRLPCRPWNGGREGGTTRQAPMRERRRRPCFSAFCHFNCRLPCCSKNRTWQFHPKKMRQHRSK